VAENRIPPTDRNGTPIKQGDRVRVFKGTLVTGTFHEPQPKITKGTHVVKVRMVFDGWHKISEHRNDGGRAPQVSWSGTNGYWNDCDASLVEVVA
jgi:uncharacterized Zn ribbon protein